MSDSMQRRASLQEADATNAHATLDFFRQHDDMRQLVLSLVHRKAAAFANERIRDATTTLQEVVFAIQKETQLAKTFLDETQSKLFLGTPLGQVTQENRRVEEMIRGMTTVISRAISDMRNIQYPSYIMSVVSATVPDIESILENLENDTTLARTILRSCEQAYATHRQDWTAILQAGLSQMPGFDGTNPTHAVGGAVVLDPALIIKLAWSHPKSGKFAMKPYFPGELEKNHLDSYKAGMLEAAASLLPETLGNQEIDTNERKQRLIDYETSLFAHFKELKTPAALKELDNLHVPNTIVQRWEEVEKSFVAMSKLRNMPLRLSVFGRYNEGKSSFINAIVGQDVLQSLNGLATAWPIMVRHRKGFKEPVLTIKSTAFPPYLSLLRLKRFSGILDSEDPRRDKDEWSRQQTWLDMQPTDIVKAIEEFENGLTFPEEVRNTTEQPYAIIETISAINKLVRATWSLAETVPLMTNEWPVIEVEFAFLTDSDEHCSKTIELLDCPGDGEQTKGLKMPPALIELALGSCLDGSFSILNAVNAKTPEWIELVKRARKLTERRPLAAYLTHMEEVDKNWHSYWLKEANSRVYDVTSKDDCARVQLCSPGPFVNGNVVLRKAGVNIYQNRPEPGESFTIPDHVWPPDPPEFNKIIDKRETGSRIIWDIWTRDTFKEAENEYQNTGYEVLRGKLNAIMKRSDFFPAIAHFQNHAIKDGFDRRQFMQLCLVRKALKDLLLAQNSLADFAMERRTDLLTQRRQYHQFQHDTSLEWDTWFLQWDKRKTDAEASLTILRGDVKKRALTAVRDSIKSAIEELNIERIGNDITIDTTDRTEFLLAVQQKLQEKLEVIQPTIVETIEDKVKAEWRTSMQSLASEISNYDASNVLYARDEIVSALKYKSNEMTMAVYTHEIGRARQHTYPIDAAEIKEMQQILADSNLAYNMACANQQGKTYNIPEDVGDVAQSVARGLNELGFMFRLCVPVASVAPDLLQAQIWTPQTSSSESVTIDIEALTKKIAKFYITPWKQMLENEVRTTLIGSTLKIRQIAHLAVVDFLKTRGSYVSEDFSRPEIPSSFLQQIVTWHACSTVIYGMVDGLCLEWARIIDRRMLHLELPNQRSKLAKMSDEVLVEKMMEMTWPEGGEQKSSVPPER